MQGVARRPWLGDIVRVVEKDDALVEDELRAALKVSRTLSPLYGCLSRVR